MIKNVKWLLQKNVTVKERKKKNMELKETISMMTSADYKERFKAEYYQTKIRYEKLRNYNNRIEAAELSRENEEIATKLEMPPHDCPLSLLKAQAEIMLEYLQTLEVRAVCEHIEL